MPRVRACIVFKARGTYLCKGHALCPSKGHALFQDKMRDMCHAKDKGQAVAMYSVED